MVIPKEVVVILEKLQAAGFAAHIVGGCVRDFLLGQQPRDWDVTTNAKPEDIQKLFPDSFYENNFLTVTVLTGSEEADLKEIEITTYRSDAKYSDKRHPDEVTYAKTIEEDLARRDFTVNAMALTEVKGNKVKGEGYEIIDPFGGQVDLKERIIKTVGNPEERFGEDALRIMRAVRLATVLDFAIEGKTAEAIKKNAVWLEAVSKERIRDEFVKMLMAKKAADGIELLRQLDLLKYILPELQENYGVGQNKHHIYDCYTHAVKALEYTAKKNFSLTVRIAALLHDIAKPKVKVGDGINSTFYNHEVVGAKMAFQILTRLKFPSKEIELVSKLVRYHLFYYNVDEVSEASVRRLVRNMGPENMEMLLQVRQADRIGSGVPKAEPYKLRHLQYVIEKVSRDPISVKMLKVNGKDVMDILGAGPGPKVGQILDILLGHVLDDPAKNTKEFLEAEVKLLGSMDEKELKSLAEKSKEDKTGAQVHEDEKTKSKYWVK